MVEINQEIEVTPAMVAAGVAFFERASGDRFPRGWLLAESFVTDLFRVMERASRDADGAGLAREKYCADLRPAS
jgi:hypothetical protein